MKKRILVLFTAIIMVFAMAACGGKQTLEELLASDEWQSDMKELTASTDGTGIVITTEADGNTLVFLWKLPADGLYSSLDSATCGTMADYFLGSLESQNWISLFKQGYGISLDAVRCTFVSSDGTEIYSDELKK